MRSRASVRTSHGWYYTTSAFMRLKLGDALTRREMAPHVFEAAAEMAADPPARDR